MLASTLVHFYRKDLRLRGVHLTDCPPRGQDYHQWDGGVNVPDSLLLIVPGKRWACGFRPVSPSDPLLSSPLPSYIEAAAAE